MADKYDAGVYQQDRLANQMFGTPGMDRSAGAAYQQLAQGAGQVLQEEQRTADVRNSNIISGIHAVGSFLATAIGKVKEAQQKEAAARQQQKNMLEDMDVAEAQYGFGTAANDMARNLQEQNMDRPQEADQQYRDFLEQQSDLVMQRFENSPRAMAKIMPALQSAKMQNVEQMGSWIMSRRSAQAQQMSSKTVEQAIQEISRIPAGDLRNSVDSFNEILRRQQSFLYQAEPILGSEAVGLKTLELKRKAGPAFFDSLLNNKPSEPSASLAYIDSVRSVVGKNDELGIYLEADDKKTLLSHLDHVENQAYTELQNKALVDELTISNHILSAGIEINSQRGNAAIQSEAQNYAARMAKGAEAEAQQIKADPRLPEKTKLALLRAKNNQIQQYKALDSIAHSNLSAIAAEGRADAREARSDAKAAAREQKQQTEHQIAEAKQNIKEALFDRRDRLRQLTLEDPVGNRPAMFQLSGEISHLSRKAAELGLAELGQRASREALNIATVAAKHEQITSPGLSIFGIQTRAGSSVPIKPGSPEFAAKQKQYVNEIQRIAAAEAAHDAEMKKAVEAGLNPRQQAKFAAAVEALKARYTGAVLQRKISEARNISLKL